MPEYCRVLSQVITSKTLLQSCDGFVFQVVLYVCRKWLKFLP